MVYSYRCHATERIEAGEFITQRELAALSGVSLATIVRLEQGRQPPRISTVRKLASVLEVESAELIEVNSN